MQPADNIENLARQRKHDGDFASALQLRLQLEELITDCGADRRSRNYNWIAFLGVHTGDFQNAIRAARLSLDLYSDIVDQPDARLATYTFMLACVLASAGNFDDAVKFGDRGIELYEKTGHSSDYVAYRRLDVQRMRDRVAYIYLDRA